MRLRFRFTIFFSLLFSVLLVLAVGMVYFFFGRSRQTEFNRRLWSQSQYSYSRYSNVKLTDSVQKIVTQYRPNTIPHLRVFILDSAGRILQNDSGQHFQLPYAGFLSRVKKKKYFFYKDDSTESAALYFNTPKETYIISSGNDMFGFKRQKTLGRILMAVTITGISLVFVLAFIIVNQVTKPLIRLGQQMQLITEKNLQERLNVKSGRLNYEEAQIAVHFNAMLDRLEKAFEIQKSFVHHASHELRTPLATMLAQTELALRKDLTIEMARKTLESLKDDQQEMIELTNSLLLLARYEKDQNSPEWPVVRLDELLYDTMSMVKRMLPNVNVSLEFAQVPDNELFLSMQGNDSLIRSAFRNLIKNAWLYSDNRSVAITIDSGSEDIYLHFDNTGKLLSQEEQERLFVPFFRASNSTQKKGFGLGLNIIQRIVALHNGRISYSIYDNLNRFTLQFPKLPHTADIDLL